VLLERIKLLSGDGVRVDVAEDVNPKELVYTFTVTNTDHDAFTEHKADTDIHITAAERAVWNKAFNTVKINGEVI
jgi:hypothetical protein